MCLYSCCCHKVFKCLKADLLAFDMAFNKFKHKAAHLLIKKKLKNKNRKKNGKNRKTLRKIKKKKKTEFTYIHTDILELSINVLCYVRCLKSFSQLGAKCLFEVFKHYLHPFS